MRLDQPIRMPKFDYMRVLRTLSWVFLGFSVLMLFSSIFGISGQMIMVMLDTLLGGRWFPESPWAGWAIAGALLGMGPALWTVPYFRKRRMLALWAPLVVVLVIGLLSLPLAAQPIPGR